MDRTVRVRYVADVASLIGGLDRAAASNEQAARRIEGSAKRAGDQLSSMQKAAVTAGAGIAVALGIAVVKSADFEAKMSAVGAATMASADVMGRLRQAAMDAGRDTQYSAAQAADAITELAKAGVSAEDILGGGLAGSLSLAAAGQMEVADAAEIAATALTQFQLAGSQVGHVADLLAAGAGKAQGSVYDMGMALKQSGLIASQYGLSVEETVGGLTAFAKAGLLGSDAGTSFKTMLQRLTPTSKEAKAEMDRLGISAFDGQGHFIGLAGVAGQLRTSLSKLTPEQRNAAIATIFGADAARAAGVLYQQGEKGIREWTDAVDEQGFAAEQAARLTDNLKGDLERLMGTVETVLINGGSAATGVLRTIVQTLDALVTAVGSVPGPVLAAGAALLAITLLGPKIAQLGSKAFGPLTTAVGKYRSELALAKAAQTATFSSTGGWKMATVEAGRLNATMTALRATTGGFKGVMSGVGSLMGGPVGIGITVATTALLGWIQAQANAAAAAKEFAATLDQQTAKFSEASRKLSAEKLLGDFSAADWKAVTQATGIGIGEVIAAYEAGGDKLAEFQKRFDQAQRDMADGLFGDSLTGKAQAWGNTVAAFAKDANRAREETLMLAEATQEAGVAADSSGTMISKIRDAVDALADPTQITESAMNLLGAAMGETGQSAGEARDEIDKLIDSMIKSGMVVLNRREAESRFRAALDDTKTALQEIREEAEKNAKSQGKHGAAIKAAGDAAVAQAKSFNLSTDAGRQNQEKLDAVARAALNLAQSIYDETGSEDKFRGSLAASRVSLIETGMRLGLSKKAAEAYADSILGIPPAKKTTVTNTAPAAASTVRTYVGVVNGVPQYKTTTVTASTNQAESAIRGFIGWLSGLRPVINVVGNIIGDILRREAGGPIPGPAAMKGRDSVLMLGAPGEHVWTDREVDAVGGHAAMYRLRAAALTGNLPKFDIGGPPGVPYSVRAMYRNTAVPAAGPASVDRSVRVGTIVAADPREAVRALDERMRMAEIVYA